MRARRQNGFTLIELLVAVAVFAVMSAMAYGGLSAVLDARDGIDRALERSKSMQMAAWRMRQDLEQIVSRPIRDSFGDRQPSLAGSPEFGLQFTRNGWRNPLEDLRSHLQRVAYRIDEDNNLVRQHWRVLDQAQDSNVVESVLFEDVSNVEWRFLDSNREWRDRWPSQGLGPRGGRSPFAGGTPVPGAEGAVTEAAPPLAIELRMTTAAWGDLRLVFAVPGARS